MKVKVVPKRPISGILPKNKWINSEMELDLNKNEILHCMNFGTVYDEEGTVIDKSYLSNYEKNLKKEIFKDVRKVLVEEFIQPKVDEVVLMGPIEVIEKEPIIEEPVVVETISEEIVEVFTGLKLVSTKKDDEYIIIETELVTNDEILKGNIYGLFTVLSGGRPSIEYKNGEEWTKFSNKFANFAAIMDGDKFVFRMIPKNDSDIKYRLSIKEGNEVLFKLEEQVKVSEL